ncbi:family 2A encapsulin nanocompartment cargo protein cysteine desulfurase [Magnetospirillum fulvum]|uniref:Cysteine desulfurase n=1 Tax=Magnetospirillum fulvum MGU-K5 TaxID=1316936 RepID=S9S9V1_MAGFU|nr:family 2A encapsulin nanocompartment cargo protein cysteine desulfurase [Magnetospirillum fulvum]EPY02627.1 cysteine desulfurase 1 [Magnetospirillum fulvum MGU-K5]
MSDPVPPLPFAGAPDPALIAQMANAFFAALPGQTAPSLGVALPSTPLVETGPSGGFVPPGAPTPPSVGHLTTNPALPGLGPLAAAPKPAPVNPTAVPPAPIPGNGDLRTIPTLLGAVLSLVPPDHAAGPVAPVGSPDLPEAAAPDLPSPATAPASAPVAAAPALPDVAGYYFIDDAEGISLREAPTASLPTRTETHPLGIDLAPTSGVRAFDAAAIRRDFPILSEQVHGKRLIWLDNAATTQKPRAVIERLDRYYEHENSNIHRAAHALAARSTDAYEAAREKVRRFLGAGSVEEIVFVRGATEAINLVAKAWGGRNLREGDEIVVSWLEHHANIVPWQQLCARTGAKLKVAPVDDHGQVILEEYERLFTDRTKIASFTQVSNALGTVTPAAEMVAIAHRHGALALVDGAQAVSHMPVDVQALGCDFYVFSGHKVFGPTGIGVLYGRKDVLDAMPPWQGGGNMIADVTFEKTVYQPAPARFEAGTGNIADAVGLGAAIDYLDGIGMANIAAWEHELLGYATAGLRSIPGLRLIGTAAEKAGVLSFVIDGCPPIEIGKALDREGIAVRAGHHCAQPILRRFGIEATVRPSLALYNTREDIDALVDALRRNHGARRTI